MKIVNASFEFEWDKGNFDKNYLKHGITQKEAEEIFLDHKLGILKDVTHSGVEERLIAIGKNSIGKLLFVVFTLRESRLRVISARAANKKETKIYEKNTQKNSKI